MRKFSGRLLLLLLLLTFFSVLSYAQTFSVTGGTWIVRAYDTNIIKLTFQPNKYSHNEHISDAVILPQKTTSVPYKINTVNGSLVLPKNDITISTFDSGTYKGFKFNLQNNERIYGGGERALPLNRRGYKLNIYNNPWYGYGEGADNLNYSVPFITSSNGYALFFDNPSRSYIDIGKSDKNILEYGASSGELNVFIIFGNNQQILQSYYKLTGTQPLPPRWAMGNLMSRFGYTSEAQVRDIYGKMQAANIPVDAIIYDLFWFGDSIKGTLGNLEWINKQKWPAPKKMITDFKKEGVQTILVTEPFFVETSTNYKASLPYLAVDSSRKPYYLTDFYFGHGGLVDIFRKDAQSWFWQFYKQQMNNGVEAWWGDLGEPERHPEDMYHNLRDLGYKRLFAANEVHNIYGHNWTKMLYQNYSKYFPEKRLFSLNRSGFAGSQRYSIFPWTGDVSRSWTGYRAQLPVLLGMSMSGIPYVHSDAGGFGGGEGDKELYVRWLQFAAFTPIFRPHGTALYEIDKGAFSFPSEAALIDEPYRTYAKTAIDMRYLFLPYNYTLAWQQAVNGKPLMAPLYYYYPADTTASSIGTEYMWGDEILVAPVLEKGIKEQKIYLPESKWLNIATSNVYNGKQWITLNADLSYMPFFAKEGSFVPTISHIKIAADYMAHGRFLLNYFPSATKTTYTWFEDDGTSKSSLAKKKYTLIQCVGQDMGKKITVTLTPSNNFYIPKRLTINVTTGNKPAVVLLNGKALPVYTESSQIKNGSVAFALWMHAINSIQVYMSDPLNKKVMLDIVK